MERSVEASTTIRAPLVRAREVLCDEPASLFTDDVARAGRRLPQVRAELVTTLGTGAAVTQDVMVEFGPVSSFDHEVVLPLSWQPVGHERLLPDFDGELVLHPDAGNTCLVLRGRYQVPLGPVGRFGDALVGRRVARQSLSGLVGQVARRLDTAVDRRNEAVSWRPAPYAVDLREDPGSEHYLG